MSISLEKKSDFNYYYSVNGNTFGPFLVNQLIDKIDGDTLVWRDGIEWTNAGDVPELAIYFINYSKKKKSSKLPLFIAIFMIFGFLAWQYFNKSEIPASRQAIDNNMNFSDSIITSSEPINIDSNSDSTNSDLQVNTSSNDSVFVAIINDYYYSLNNNLINAEDYFSENIDQFINLKNTSPQIINQLISSNSEFLNANSTIIDSTIVSNNKIIQLWVNFSCFRNSKQKYQTCDIKVQFIFDDQNKIKSYKELAIKDLTFTE